MEPLSGHVAIGLPGSAITRTRISKFCDSAAGTEFLRQLVGLIATQLRDTDLALIADYLAGSTDLTRFALAKALQPLILAVPSPTTRKPSIGLFMRTDELLVEPAAPQQSHGKRAQ